MGKEALLLIDIQDFYFMPGSYKLNNPCEAAKRAAVLLEKFRQENKTVIHVQHKKEIFMGIHKSVTPLPTERIVQ